MCQDSQVTHVDHVDGSHALLKAHSQVLARELINDVTDLKDTPLPVRVELDINRPHLPRSASHNQVLQVRHGARLKGFARSHAQPVRCATSAGTYHAPRQCPHSWPAPRHVYSPTVDAWRQNRSSTGAQAHDHAVILPRPPRGSGNTLTATARQRGMQDAEKTPDRQGGSQPRACAPGLEVSLCQLSQRCLFQLCLAQQLFEARVLLAQLTQFLGLTTTHRPVTLAPPAQRRLADTQHAAGLGRTHALTSQRLGLLQLHDNALRHVRRELPHGHPFCPATSSRDYSKHPSRNKRCEKPRPLHKQMTSISHHDSNLIAT